MIGAVFLWDEDFTFNFIISNVYKIQDSDELLKYFQIVNKANDYANIGNFGVFDNKKIVYKSSTECEKDYTDLTEELIKKHILAFSDNILYLFSLINESEEKNNG